MVDMCDNMTKMCPRSANSEKDAFRKDPTDPEVLVNIDDRLRWKTLLICVIACCLQVAHLTYMATKRGTRLITSGWWGLARKINYTGLQVNIPHV